MRMFQNREEAGRELAADLAFLRGQPCVVMAVSNGALPIALAICERLDAPLDMLVLGRLHAPRMPDHVVGAVDEHGRISLIEQTARWHHLTAQKMIGPAREAFRDLQPFRAKIRSILPEQEVRGKTVIVVNEGVTSGAAILAAVASVKDRGAAKVVAAAPAGQEIAIRALHEAADMVVIPHVPAKFKGVDRFYKHFDEISDAAAVQFIRNHVSAHGVEMRSFRSVAMPVIAGDGERTIYCEVEIPHGEGPFPCVIFAHGFDSNCRSPRSVPISMRLAKRGVMGVRLDFQGHGRSDGDRDACTHENMLADLRTVYENLRYDMRVSNAQIGLCGAGTGAAVALDFAADEPHIAALVIRGPVCAGAVAGASSVTAPTLTIHAEGNIDLARDVAAIDNLLPATHRLLAIPDCHRLFNDPISMELMVNASVDWLHDHLRVAGGAGREAPAAEHPAEQIARTEGG